MNDDDKKIMDHVIKRSGIKSDFADRITNSLYRVDAIDESKTFHYKNLKEFEKDLEEIIKLKEKATASFRPFAKKYNTTLCASMGVPMMESVMRSKNAGMYQMFHEIFGITNAKAKRFGLAALYCAMDGIKSEIPHPELPYNIVFDRDSPWTYRNEAEHMEEYARYHFNSYVINEVDSTSNPFEPVISLYEKEITDFIFMQTEENGIRDEKLATFHMINIPLKGNVIGVHVGFDNHMSYFRRWGDPYFVLRSVDDKSVKLKITGIADQRFQC